MPGVLHIYTCMTCFGYYQHILTVGIQAMQKCVVNMHEHLDPSVFPVSSQQTPSKRKRRVKSRVIYHIHIFLSMGGGRQNISYSSILKIQHPLTLSSQLYILGRCYSGKDSSSILFSIRRVQKKMHIMSMCLALALMCYIYCFLLGEHLQISDSPWVGIIFYILWDLPSE